MKRIEISARLYNQIPKPVLFIFRFYIPIYPNTLFDLNSRLCVE